MHSGIRHFEFVDEFPAALYRSTLEGTLLYCNRHYARLLGYESPTALMGSAEADLFRDKTDRGRLLDLLQRHPVAVDVPIAFRRRDGSELVCAVTARGTSDDDGVMVHVDGMLHERASGEDGSTVELGGEPNRATAAAHLLNPPLTMVGDQLRRLLGDLDVGTPLFDRVRAILQQVERLAGVSHRMTAGDACPG